MSDDPVKRLLVANHIGNELPLKLLVVLPCIVLKFNQIPFGLHQDVVSFQFDIALIGTDEILLARQEDDRDRDVVPIDSPCHLDLILLHLVGDERDRRLLEDRVALIFNLLVHTFFLG